MTSTTRIRKRRGSAVISSTEVEVVVLEVRSMRLRFDELFDRKDARLHTIRVALQEISRTLSAHLNRQEQV